MEGSAGLITLKGHLLLAPRSAALSLQVTEWGGFCLSRALGEPGGYKKRRRGAAGRRRQAETNNGPQRGAGEEGKGSKRHSTP